MHRDFPPDFQAWEHPPCGLNGQTPQSVVYILGKCRDHDGGPIQQSPGGKGMQDKVEAALAQIRPALQADGGDVELVAVEEDGTVKVRLTGACGGCPMASLTLRNGIERTLKQAVPEVKQVVAV